jgi:hypothetical protein
MVCFVCKTEIKEGQEIVLSERYQIYMHATCNSSNTCFVCGKKFVSEKPLLLRRGVKKFVPDKHTFAKDIVRVGSQLKRHSWCGPGSLTWYKTFKETMPEEYRRIYERSEVQKELAKQEQPFKEGQMLRRREIEEDED